MKRLSSRELRRLQQRMMVNLGLNMEEVGVAREVVIKLENKELVVKGPSVLRIVAGGENVFQVVGGEISERAYEEKPVEEEVEFPEEDVYLVASQAGASEEEARQALKEAGGDLAKAILLLKSGKR